MRPFSIFAPLCVLGCSDFNLEGLNDPGKNIDDSATSEPPDVEELGACSPGEWPAEAVSPSDTCQFGTEAQFDPVVNWEAKGENACSLPAVGDLDGDGMPEIVVTFGWIFDSLAGKSELAVYSGDGKLEWETSGAHLAYGSGPALADLDGDGQAEIIAVKMYEDNLFGNGDYSLVMYSSTGDILAESGRYTDGEFDHATGIAISDMDHDGHAEIVAGRAIFNDDLTERAVGREGRGCDDYFGVGLLYGEGSNPAIADMDLDGTEEVVVGNAFYSPDGVAIMKVRGGSDGAVAIANLDGDKYGEFIRATYSELEAIDTDGTSLWVRDLPGGVEDDGIMSIPAVGDIDGDGLPEVVSARFGKLWAVNGEDGSVLWSKPITDVSGATGASLFDFEGDGIQEVVYIDEVAMYAFDGTDGSIKFQSDKHASDTMYDYPTIADVDADGHADIVVTHDGYSSGFSVYTDKNNSWTPARSVWNEHPYMITNVNDDLTIPETAVQNFTVYNSFHSGWALPPQEGIGAEMQAEVLETCDDDCDRGWFEVTGRVANSGAVPFAAGLKVSLYAEKSGKRTLLDTQETDSAVDPLRTSEALVFIVAKADIAKADRLVLVADDDGSGTGQVTECSEVDNEAVIKAPFCE